jgi:predicted transcriptional regulator
MIKALERAIEKIKTLSEQRQQYAAEVLEEIAELGDDEVYRLSDEERRLVHQGLTELDRGEVASETEVRAVFDKYRK